MATGSARERGVGRGRSLAKRAHILSFHIGVRVTPSSVQYTRGNHRLNVLSTHLSRDQISFDRSPETTLPCSSHARRAERVRKVPTGMAACRRFYTSGAACLVVRRAVRYDHRDRLCRASVVAVANAASRVEAHDVGEGVVRGDRLSKVQSISITIAVITRLIAITVERTSSIRTSTPIITASA